MKKIIPIALAILLLLCTALGCASKSSAYENATAAKADAYYAEAAPAPEYEPEPAEAGYGLYDESKPIQTQPAALSNRKIIRNADVSAETLAFDTFLDQLSAAVDGIGGYIESSSIGGRTLRNDQRLRTARFAIRVPAEQLDAFLNAVSGFGNVTSMNTGLRDVTTNYVDSEKHLESLRIEQQALMDILAKATTVEDIITVQDRLTYVRYEIESYEAILRTYDDQIALSTVNLTVSEVVRETPVEEETFGQEVSRRFSESLEDIGNGFRDFASWFLGNAPEILLILLLFVGLPLLIVLLCIRGAKKRRAKRREKALAAKQEAETPKNPEA